MVEDLAQGCVVYCEVDGFLKDFSQEKLLIIQNKIIGDKKMRNCTKWTMPNPTSFKASVNPALAICGPLCMTWVRPTEPQRESSIFTSVSNDNGINWSDPIYIPNRKSDFGPQLCHLNGKFLMAWQENVVNVFVADSADGINWSEPNYLQGFHSSIQMGLAGAGGLAVMCGGEVKSDRMWVSTSTDGLNWSTPKILSGFTTKRRVGLTGTEKAPDTPTGKKFVLAWQGENQTDICIAQSADGLNWSEPVTLENCPTYGVGITHSDSLDMFYLSWVDRETQCIMGTCSTDGTAWPAPEVIQKKELAFYPISSTMSCPSGDTLIMCWVSDDPNDPDYQNRVITSLFEP
jgi:hypothetical protein